MGFANKDQERIFGLFTVHRELSFSDIERSLSLKSNLLSYHLSRLVEVGLLVHDGSAYRLSKDGEKLMPSFAHVSGSEKGPLAIVVAAVREGDRICLLRRSKRPYKGYWGLIGGKIRLEESIRETALREVEEETGLVCSFERVSAVLHERVVSDGFVKHSFVIFLCVLSCGSCVLKRSDEGEVDWFPLSAIPPKIIPSDGVMIDELLDKSGVVRDVILSDEEDSITGMRMGDGGSF